MRRQVLIILLITALFVAGCTSQNQQMRYQSSQQLMDTTITISLYASNQTLAHEALEGAFGAMEEAEQMFTIHEESPIRTLNNQGTLHDASPAVTRLMRRALHYANITNGSFDISIQPLLDLYAESFGEDGQPPSEEEINATLQSVDYRDITVKEGSIVLNGSDMRVTMGGIAKGYAIDRAIEVLKEHNITSALVNAGGDMRAYGSKPDGPWTVAVRNPREGGYLMDFALRDQAVATSGDYERYFNPNKSFHHIVDPRTGYSAQDSISATVIAPTAQQADALSTGVFVLGPKEGVSLVESRDEMQALVISANRTLHYSEEFPR